MSSGVVVGVAGEASSSLGRMRRLSGDSSQRSSLRRSLDSMMSVRKRSMSGAGGSADTTASSSSHQASADASPAGVRPLSEVRASTSTSSAESSLPLSAAPSLSLGRTAVPPAIQEQQSEKSRFSGDSSVCCSESYRSRCDSASYGSAKSRVPSVTFSVAEHESSVTASTEKSHKSLQV